MLLVITDRRELGKELASILSNQGIFTFACPLETGEFYCDQKDTGGVLLDCVSDLKAGEKLCRALRNAYPPMPILAIVSKDAIPEMEADRILREDALKSLLPDILDFCERNCGWVREPLTTYFLTVGNTRQEVVYMGYPLLLSERGFEILRCLFYRYPELTSASDLMSLCYPEGTEQIGNLAVQIHHINQCAEKIDPRPLVVNLYGKGYKLRDGIL